MFELNEPSISVVQWSRSRFTKENRNMIFLTVVACKIGRNIYFADTNQRTGSGFQYNFGKL